MDVGDEGARGSKSRMSRVDEGAQGKCADRTEIEDIDIDEEGARERAREMRRNG